MITVTVTDKISKYQPTKVISAELRDKNGSFFADEARYDRKMMEKDR